MDGNVEVKLCALDLEHVEGHIAEAGGEEAGVVIVVDGKGCRACNRRAVGPRGVRV